MGYSLNQRGLYAGVIRVPNDYEKKLSEGARTSLRIFIPYQPYQKLGTRTGCLTHGHFFDRYSSSVGV